MKPAIFICLLTACVAPETDAESDTDVLVAYEPTWPMPTWAEAPAGEVGMSEESVQAALDYAFTPAFSTQGAVVIKDGYIVGERYAEGADKDSLATSWSMAKSMLSITVGVAIDDGAIESVDQPISAHLSQWDTPPLKTLTFRNLLEMRSGLPDPSTDGGIYFAVDQLAYALDRAPIRQPGQVFLYANTDSMTVGGAVEEAMQDDLPSIATERLFAPLGMNAEWWVDGAGHGLGYCCVDATTRDYARFGLMVSRGGTWEEQRIVSEAWIDLSTSPAAGQDFYGLHWWVDPKTGLVNALGLHGQTVTIDRANDLVLVRNGSYTRVGTEAVRVGTNYHQTVEPGAWDVLEFARLARQDMQ